MPLDSANGRPDETLDGSAARGDILMTTEEMANQIDAYYDQQLYEGMQLDEALRIEQARQKDHQKMAQQLLKQAVETWG